MNNALEKGDFVTARRLEVIAKKTGTKFDFDYNPTHFKKYTLYEISDEIGGPETITDSDSKDEINRFVMGLWYFTLAMERAGRARPAK